MDNATKLRKVNEFWYDAVKRLNEKLDRITEDRRQAIILARTSTALCRAVLRELRTAEVVLDTEGTVDAVEARLRVVAAIRRVEVHDEDIREILMSLDLEPSMLERESGYTQLELGVLAHGEVERASRAKGGSDEL